MFKNLNVIIENISFKDMIRKFITFAISIALGILGLSVFIYIIDHIISWLMFVM